MSDQDVIIIGAPRSGTNMLRDVLTGLTGFTTWPCDEINLVWRHGNRDHPSDELTAAHATPEVREYIRRQFDKARRRYDGPVVVEKTCANSLRVEFVRAVKPDARYVFITRDGLDAAPSAMERWDARFDLRYTAAKARFVPPGDVPYYGVRFVANRLRRRQRLAGKVGHWWGPRPADAAELMATRSLDEICMAQWSRCVEASLRGLAGLPEDRLHHVRYEDFVARPQEGLRTLLGFLGRPEAYDESAVAAVSALSVGKGRRSLDAATRKCLNAVGGATLTGLGYELG
mgnify:CR=1 FL=1|jgi:hypothetical protein